MHAKLINGDIVLAPNPILVAGLWYGNPPDEIYALEGYKPVLYTEQPEADPGYIVTHYWEETEIMGDPVIVQRWREEPEPDKISEERAYRIITGEEV